MAEVLNEKRVRALSLFSASTTYTRAHIKLNATTLYGSYARIKKQVDRALAQEAIDQSKDKRITFVSTPAAYRDFLKLQEESDSPIDDVNVFLFEFEFDHRFDEKYSEHYIFYV